MTISSNIHSIPTISLFFEDSCTREEIWKFLRFSTHANYLCHENFEQAFNFSPYWLKMELKNDRYIKPDARILFAGNEIKFMNSTSGEFYFEEDKVDFSIESFIELIQYYFYHLIEQVLYRNDSQATKLTMDFLIDFEGDVRLLGVIPEYAEDRITGEVILNSDMVNEFNSNKYSNPKIKSEHCNQFIQLTAVRDNSGSIKTEDFQLNRVSNFYLYGLAGVNIPLIAVMNSIRYKVMTHRMISQANIIFNSNSEFGYNLDYNTVYIDLDQTLIWLWYDRRIDELYHYLLDEKKCGRRIILISRHERDILETLEMVEIDKGIFSEILKIETHELKSSFISDTASIFIDDEHGQRIDVRKKCGIPVFDLFQTKYLAIR